MRGGGEIISDIFSALLDHPPILSQVSTLSKPHHSIPKIHLYVGQPYQTPHHFGLILDHYHPLFTLITQDPPPEISNPSPSGGGPVMAIVLEHQLFPQWEQVIKLYNAELLLVSTRQSYLNSIQDLKGTGLTVNTGPIGSYLDQLARTLLKRAGIKINHDVYITNYSDRDIVELFGYGVDLFFSLNATPCPLINQISMRLPINLVSLKLGQIDGLSGLEGLHQVNLNMEKFRKYYAHLDNFILHHIWSYTMSYIMITPTNTDSEIRNIVTETVHDLLPMLESLPYWDLPIEPQGLPGIPNPRDDSVPSLTEN